MLFLLLVAFVAISCVSAPAPYQPLPLDGLGGYKEVKQKNGSYKLIYIGTLQVDINTTKKYWARRAAELCNGKGYKREITQTKDLVTEKQVSGGITVTRLVQPPSVEGVVSCN